MTIPRVSQKAWLVVLLVGAFAAGGSLASAHPPKGAAKAATKHTPSEDELRAYEAARPVFEKHCFRCHATDGRKAKRKTLAHLNMDRYPFTGHHAHEAGATVRRVLGVDGSKPRKPTMPSDDKGAVVGAELDKVMAWAATFDAAQASTGKQKTGPPAKPHQH